MTAMASSLGIGGLNLRARLKVEIGKGMGKMPIGPSRHSEPIEANNFKRTEWRSDQIEQPLTSSHIS